ncbi:hypothetical protein BP6252_08034 [Coleophoma cylindrospora]|uniref:Mid2 domain-containing protein n=1 Tax=Coleophoma cylindrospora TaxID=1849047 RepID=A0A3D8RC65_9HELO|nr:hypothetical protein BP6252_08034 [Coleophoma cylindrospora]
MPNPPEKRTHPRYTPTQSPLTALMSPPEEYYLFLERQAPDQIVTRSIGSQNTPSHPQPSPSTYMPMSSTTSTSPSTKSPELTQMNASQKIGQASKSVVIGSVVAAAVGIAVLAAVGYGAWRWGRRVVDDEEGS